MVLSFSAFLLYSFISCINDVNIPSLYMLGNTLYTLPYLIIFFIFFTFECCYKLNRYYEPICITKKGMKCVYKNQLQSIFLYDLLLFAEALLFNVIYIFANKQFSLSLVIHTLVVLIIYFLLCILSAIFIGFLLSKIKGRFVSYIIMLIIAISETNLMDSLSVGVYNSTGTDITKSLKFFNIAPASIGWTQQIIFVGNSSTSPFKKAFYDNGFNQNSLTNTLDGNGARGYVSRYAYTLGYQACLFEFPKDTDPTDFFNDTYGDYFIKAIKYLLDI